MSKTLHYSEFVELYEKLYVTPGRLEKISILSEFLKKLASEGQTQWIYLLRGSVLPDYDPREFGISDRTILKAIAFGFGIKESDLEKHYRKVGDLGEIAEEFAGKKKQVSLFSTNLTAAKVFANLRKLVDIEGKGTVQKKLDLIAELLGSATGKEAKYIVRTILSDLRIGLADATLRDAISLAFFPENSGEMSEKIGRAYDLSNDFAVVFEAAQKGPKALEKIDLQPGRPTNVMLATKVESIEEAFKVCGRPAALEHKYDGFRMVIHKVQGRITLFTRRLEDVTSQFPDVVEVVEKYVNGTNFILDSEVVGYDPTTKVYKPFEAISQRIRRKYEIEKLTKELPVEVNIFDVLYLDGENKMEIPFIERRKIIEKIVKEKKLQIRPAKQIITDNDKEAEEFYEEALSFGEEGIMVKKIDSPYAQGRKVGYMVKMKPVLEDFDLVILGAEYGSGKRGGLLTSYIVGCKKEDQFLEIGKVSSGLKELEQEGGTTYTQMTALLKPLITEEHGNSVNVKPKIVVSVTYQNIQKSPSYTSGYALRFPRITHYRPDKSPEEIATFKEIEKEFERMQRN